MFINFWYPAIESANLTDRPVKVQMLGCEFVVFRDAAGAAHCLANTCVHRGGSLGDGRIVADAIECPYHGWRYDGRGVCRRIPSLGPQARIPGRARVDSYGVQEKYGLVFAFLGDLEEAERPPLQTVTEWGDEGWRGTWTTYVWEANIERAVENSLDTVHNEFVHPNQGDRGERADYKVPDVEIRESQWGTEGHMLMYAPPIREGGLRDLRKAGGHMQAATGHRGPNQLWNQLHLTDTNWLHMYQFAVPIDSGRSRFWLLTMRNSWLQPEVDTRFNDRNTITSEEDRIVLEKLRPVIHAGSNSQELLVGGDELVMRYRQALAHWQAKGWKIDVERMRVQQESAVLAIPSEGRRQSGQWVLDTVPLLPAVAPRRDDLAIYREAGA